MRVIPSIEEGIATTPQRKLDETETTETLQSTQIYV